MRQTLFEDYMDTKFWFHREPLEELEKFLWCVKHTVDYAKIIEKLLTHTTSLREWGNDKYGLRMADIIDNVFMETTIKGDPDDHSTNKNG